MNIDKEKITFITPNNVKFDILCSKIGEFTEKYCLEWANKSEENMEIFREFSNNYTHFKPYYDFLICVLDFVSYPSLVDINSYVVSNSKPDRVTLHSTTTIRGDDYNCFKDNNKEAINVLLNANDTNLGINSISDNSLDGFFDEYGNFYNNSVTFFHEETSRILLNAICAANGDVLLDSRKYISNNLNLIQDYLIQRLGFVGSGSYRGHMCLSYNPLIVSGKQRKIIRELLEEGYEDDLRSPINLDDEETKAFINNYRRIK